MRKPARLMNRAQMLLDVIGVDRQGLTQACRPQSGSGFWENDMHKNRNLKRVA